MNNFEFFIPLVILLNFFFYKKLIFFSNFFSIYDYPDNERKIHKKPTPILGGVFLYLNLVFLLLLNFYFNIFNFNYLNFFIFSSLLFFVTIFDDKYNISAIFKFIIVGIIIIFYLFFNKEYLITNIIFDYKILVFDNLLIKFFVSFLCIMLFLNAMNLYDGINGQLILYSIVFIIFLLINNIMVPLFSYLIIILSFLLILNLKNKIFSGDSGSFLLAFIFSHAILTNNSTPSSLNAEIIFLLMFIPGFDMFRLFVERLFNMKNPFNADRNHLHHLLLKKFSNKQILLLNFLFYVTPLFLSYYFNKLIIILFVIIFYLFLIYYYLGHKPVKQYD